MPFIGPLSGTVGVRQSNQPAHVDQANHYHRRRSYSTYTGANSGTYVILRMGKHYWGTGNYHIHIFETWYNANAYGHFMLHGHTRSGNPSIHTVSNTGSPTPSATNYNSTYERCDIQFSHASYFRYTIICECFETNYTDTPGDVGHGANAGASSWHMYGSTELI